MNEEAIQVGLRIDVDTLRGTRLGVPALVKLFDKYHIKTTFFMSVGPDNMGRHLWRLLKPQFLIKMLRSNAANLYGYDILLRGTAWPGPVIGDRLPEIIRLPHQTGHEMGLHAWDHYTWQAHIDRMTESQLEWHVRRGYDKLSEILGVAPVCSAAAGWRCETRALLIKEKFPFRYNSDCRGTSVFRPVVNGQKLAPQIPVTLPTYDEIIGSNGVIHDNYNDTILNLCKPGQFNVYTIHAEAEGIGQFAMFERMLQMAKERQISFVPLGSLLQRDEAVASGIMVKKETPGREGWVATQGLSH